MSLEIEEKDEENEALLISEISRQMRICFDRKAQRLGLTRSQWRVLCVLDRSPGIKQIRLADILEIEPISLARLLDRMSKAGWIIRTPAPEDRRANHVYLTEKVKEVVEEMHMLALNVRHDALKGFSNEEHAILTAYLTRIKINITATLPTEESS